MSSKSNPARELHELLTAWAERSSNKVSQYEARALGGSASPIEQAHDGTIRACGFLTAIDERIQSLAATGIDVAAFRVQVRTWSRMVFVSDIPWTSGGERDVLYPADALNTLSVFATVLDISPNLNPSISPIEAYHVHEYIEAVAAALKEDVDLPDDYRAYLSWIIDSVRESIDGGDAEHLFRLLQTVHHGLFRAAAESGKPGLWNGLIAQWSGDVMKNTAASIVSTTVQSAIGM